MVCEACASDRWLVTGDCRAKTIYRLGRTGGREKWSFGRRGAGLHLSQELIDSRSLLLRVIEAEVEIGHATQLQTFEDFVTDEADGVFESLNGAFLLFLGAPRADENAGISAVGRQADFVDDHGNFEPRVFQFAGQHGIDLMGDFFADTFVTMVRSGHGSAIIFLQHRGKKHKPPRTALQQVDGMVDQDRTQNALGFGQDVLQRFFDVLLGV